MTMIEVPDGHIATIVTHLEMIEKPAIDTHESSLTITAWLRPNLEEYRALFRKVGEPWLWLSRLLMSDKKLATIIHDPAVEFFVIRNRTQDVGFIELDFREPGQCEIGFLGLIPKLNGAGHGRWLMRETLERAWREGTNRVWLHTCTLDSPRALGLYQSVGFVAFEREIETFPDPRLSGHLSKNAAPHIPIIS